MTTTETHHEPTPDEAAHARADLGAGRGDGAGDVDGHDEHDHGGEALGPVDMAAWGALAIGVGAGLLIVLCLVITTSLL